MEIYTEKVQTAYHRTNNASSFQSASHGHCRVSITSFLIQTCELCHIVKVFEYCRLRRQSITVIRLDRAKEGSE